MKDYISGLPDEILEIIFKYCKIQDLCRLSQTCRRFRLFIRNEIGRKTKWNLARYPLVTNQWYKCMLDRSTIVLSIVEKYRISHNWQIGKYAEHILLTQNTRYMPWMHLDKNHLWLSRGSHFKRFERNSHGIIFTKPDFIIKEHRDNITRFKVKHGRTILSLRGGVVSLWENSNIHLRLRQHIERDENGDVYTVDIGPRLYAAGTRNGFVKVCPWPENLEAEQNKQVTPLIDLWLQDRIWSLNLNKSSTYLALGTSGYNEPPLIVLDLETKETILSARQNARPGAGLLDMHWQDDNCLLTCGYEATVRLWDIRCGKYVSEWDEPHDVPLYAIQSDDLYTFMCGTRNHGKVTLWDQRKKRAVQLYFLSLYRKESSPVYSIGFDATTLYGALDRSVHVLNFWSRNNQIRNYNYT